jgi:adenine/guanine phosphoribosyltransferase-like PRPP-binding protein
MANVNSGYFDTAFDKREQVIGKALGILKHKREDFDVIVCRGYSGMVIAPTLAFCLKKKLFVVRKDGERCHSGQKYIGDLGEKYLMVDDFISSGKTYEAILLALTDVHEREALDPPKLAAIYLYESFDDSRTYRTVPIWSDRLDYNYNGK